jgi:hypothetical protein
MVARTPAVMLANYSDITKHLPEHNVWVDSAVSTRRNNPNKSNVAPEVM